MDGTFVKAMVEELKGRTFEVNGRTYTDGQLREVLPYFPEPQPLQTSTLTGLKMYVQENRDGLAIKDLSLHVAGPASVLLLGMAEMPNLKRRVWMTATPPQRQQFPWGQWLDPDVFMVALLTQFEQNPDLDYLTALASKVTAGKELTYEDSGVAQVVTVKKGVALKESVAVRPWVELRPYRSFNELPQPPGKFLLRVKQDDPDDPPQFTLREADGGAWQIVAIRAVADWLQREIPEVSVLA